MYVPGDDEKKLRKTLELDVDCIVMDCEDGVALNKKVNMYGRNGNFKLILYSRRLQDKHYEKF